MKFYTDVHIAREVIRQLRSRDIDIVHCGEVGLADADDITHLDYATKHQRIMVTCDEGFERYHASWQKIKKPHAGIVYFRMKDQCQSVGVIVKELLFLYEAADYDTDLYNQIWRAQG